MLLPALSRARESSRRTTCLNNLKQLGLAITMYLQDNNEGFLGREIAVDLDPYVPDGRSFDCPSEKKSGTDGGYAINSNVIGQKLSIVGHPSTFPLIFDRSMVSGVFQGNDGDSGFYYDICSNRHSQGTNFLFLDSHAAWISKPKEAGKNILNFDVQ
ncbi:MAG: DUF1559 domain-containing protein [Candidatus Omnitrophica bacterium]|nr:DUF1559 domain-containing protein [Candidatus Omnitrophota bacterium]